MDFSPYFRDSKFWYKPVYEYKVNIWHDIELFAGLLDKIPFSEKDSEKLPKIAWDLLHFLLGTVSGRTNCFRPAFTLEDVYYGDEEIEEKHPKYFLKDMYIVKRYTHQPLLIAHAHADETLDSEEDLKDAEDHMKSALTKWLDDACMDVLYGVIIIGGAVAFYQMDQKNEVFARIINGVAMPIDSTPSEMKWMTLDRTAALSELLNIVMKSWADRDPDGMARAIELIKKQAASQADDSIGVDRERTTSGGSHSSKATEGADIGYVTDREISPDREQYTMTGSGSESSPEKSETSEDDSQRDLTIL